MLTRFALLSLFLAVSLPTCKKNETAAHSSTAPNQPNTAAGSTAPGPSSSTAPAAPANTPVATKPVIDQNAQVMIFGYHRFVNNVRRPDTEITPQAFEAQMQELKNKNISVIP